MFYFVLQVFCTDRDSYSFHLYFYDIIDPGILNFVENWILKEYSMKIQLSLLFFMYWTIKDVSTKNLQYKTCHLWIPRTEVF